MAKKKDNTLEEIELIVEKINDTTGDYLSLGAADALDRLADIAKKLHKENQRLERENKLAWSIADSLEEKCAILTASQH